jgi:FHS family Na+ dependent glucose MFS transporter 1
MTTHTQPKPISPRLLTAVYYLSFIALGLSFAAEGPSLPALARHTSTQLDEISLIFVFGSLGYLIGSLLGGRAFDKFPGHRLIAFSLLVIAAALVIVPLASTLWILLLALFIGGLAKGTLDVGCNTLIQWVHGEKVGPFMNGLHFTFGVGTFLAPLLLAQIISITQEIHWVFWTISLVTAPLAVWFWFLPEPVHAHVHEETGVPIPFVPVLLIILAFILYVGAEAGFGNWIYTYSTTLGMATTITGAYLTSAFWGFFTLGRLLGIWVSTRIRSRTILFLDLAGCLASLGLILLSRDSVPLLWIGSIGLGLSMASIVPTMLILVGQSMRVSGAVTGWFFVGGAAGGMLIPWVIGEAFTATGPHAMMSIIFATMAADALILLYFIYGIRRDKTP